MKQLIERLRQLEAGATPGPWEFVATGATEDWEVSCEGSYKIQPVGGDEYSYFICDATYYNTAPKLNDAALISEMRNSIFPLLDRLEKLEAVVEAAKHQHWSQNSRELNNALAALEEKGKK